MEQHGHDDLGLKPSISIICGVGWLIFVILWLAFYATAYPWEKNLSILLLSILILFLLMGGMWAIYGLRQIPKRGWEIFEINGFRWHVIVSIVLPLTAMVFLILWFWHYAIPYSVWQNVAVILVTVLASGGILGAIWAHWGMEHSQEMKQCETIDEEKDENGEESMTGTKKKNTSTKKHS